MKAEMKPTNTDKIVAKATNEYKDYPTKDIEKWQKKVYQPQTTSYAYEPELPNRPYGTTVTK